MSEEPASREWPVAVPELTPEAIRAAYESIDPVFTRSPQFVHDGLTTRLGVPVVVKVETVNPIRAFKGRGTWVAVHGLAGEGRIAQHRPVVVASAGNFGHPRGRVHVTGSNV